MTVLAKAIKDNPGKMWKFKTLFVHVNNLQNYPVIFFGTSWVSLQLQLDYKRALEWNFHFSILFLRAAFAICRLKQASPRESLIMMPG